jgi:ribosomal protein L13E
MIVVKGSNKFQEIKYTRTDDPRAYVRYCNQRLYLDEFMNARYGHGYTEESKAAGCQIHGAIGLTVWSAYLIHLSDDNSAAKVFYPYQDSTD